MNDLTAATNAAIDATMTQVASVLWTGSVIVACIGVAMLMIPILSAVSLTRSERRDSRFAVRF